MGIFGILGRRPREEETVENGEGPPETPTETLSLSVALSPTVPTGVARYEPHRGANGKMTVKKIPRKNPKENAEKQYQAAAAANAALRARTSGDNVEEVAMPDGSAPVAQAPADSLRAKRRKFRHEWARGLPDDWWTWDTHPWKLTEDGSGPERDPSKFDATALKEWRSWRDAKIINKRSMRAKVKKIWADFANHQLARGLGLDLKDAVPIMDYIEHVVKGRA
jgi:hypothetical protein